MLAETAWSTLFELPQIAIVMGCLTGIAVIVGVVWCNVETTKSNNELKRTLVDRGLPADEIERIMAAGKDEDDE